MVVAFSCALEVMRLVLLADSYDKVVAYGSGCGCWKLLSSPRAYYTGIVVLRRWDYFPRTSGTTLALDLSLQGIRFQASLPIFQASGVLIPQLSHPLCTLVFGHFSPPIDSWFPVSCPNGLCRTVSPPSLFDS
ncbi:hypothetical protein P7K49_029503 [Saguinus oedipus]|uniref:Uncharacterized protein n=1 Tax=Saguinus oedipus TaxID=9490 RepID=A0ABQ9U7D2_SAGOE|nr:hypothetical protein P7K49_029503 [Saguinus oedipus]